MKKSAFKNTAFYWIIITIIGGLLIWNISLTIAYLKPIGLLPITIQSILLILIFIKHEFAKIGIKIWAIIFLSIASSLQLVGRFLQEWADGFENISLDHYVITSIKILIGVFIVVYTNKFVVVEMKENDAVIK